ncbi:response regulator [Streptomyces sp. LE64]|uniref:response regulator n=1 Tax=Streptomyces sp. LE64 TaxID=3448653 RepID=UPI004042236D
MPSDAKILIVADHEDTLYALESALSPLTHDVVCAMSGDAALKEVLRGNTGLLLLDLRVPDVSGLEVVRYMRRVEQTQYIPIVLVTGFGPDAVLSSAAFRLGVADLVPKPVDPWALRTKVSFLFRTHQRLRTLEGELRDLRSRAAARTVSVSPRTRGPHLADPILPAPRELPLRPDSAPQSG